MSDDETFYEVLSIPRDASPETVERAYRRQVKQCHPDVSDDPNAREQFERVTRARAVLSDRAERRRYDRLGHEAYRARQNGDVTTPSTSSTPATSPDHDDRRETAASTDARPGNGATGSTGGTEPGHDATRERSRESGGTTAESGRDNTTEAAPLGRFLLREVAATVAVGLGAAAAAALALVLRPPLASVGVFLVSWAVVAAVAGRLAAGGRDALPDDVVRAHAFPVLVLVAAWYVAIGTDYRLVAGGLLAYAAFAALFRSVALVSGGSASTGRAAGAWFLATVPGALLVYVSSTGTPDALSPVVVDVLTAVPLPGGREAAVVVAAVPVAALVLGHALWRLGTVVA